MLFDAAQRQQLLLLLLSSGLSVGGQVLIKIGLNRVEGAARMATAELLLRVATSLHVYLGLALYGVSMLLFFKLLAQASLLTVGFSLALGYVMLVVMASTLLGETMSWQQWIGAALIVAGVLIINAR
jgi:multidrug transporter EmrE-like cation transporter